MFDECHSLGQVFRRRSLTRLALHQYISEELHVVLPYRSAQFEDFYSQVGASLEPEPLRSPLPVASIAPEPLSLGAEPVNCSLEELEQRLPALAQVIATGIVS